ncbi:MAG: hypothetical protein IM638_10565 [Bacteroidetes bacterium]|nr:hypothetical protein [Bacteroidota bacterium]
MPTLKLISWNIDKMSTRVLNRRLSNVTRNCGLGNTTLHYMTNFITGSPVWNNGNQGVPADVIIIIEPKSGNQGKGQNATGQGPLSVQQLINALNAAINNLNMGNQYNYLGAPLLNINRAECMSIIYNNRVLAMTGSGVLRNNQNAFLLPRTPFWARFTTVTAPNTPINIIGVHGPQKGDNKGGMDHVYDAQLRYADALAGIPEVIQQNETVIIAGDFNCSTCSKSKRQIIVNGVRRATRTWGFGALVNLNYTTQIPNPMFQNAPPAAIYSTIRRGVNNNFPAPLNYLSEAYDTALYHLVPQLNIVQQVDNLIGTARNTLGAVQNGNQTIQNGLLVTNHLPSLLKQYKNISDHLPTTTLFDYP